MSHPITFNTEEAAQLTEYMELTDDLLTKQAEDITQLKQENEQLKQVSEKQAAEGESKGVQIPWKGREMGYGQDVGCQRDKGKDD